MAENNKIKVPLNRRVLLGGAALLTCLAVIAVSSFVPFIINPKRWQTAEFLTDELIIVAITVISLISMLFISQSSNAQQPKSNLAKARSKFFETVEKIVDLNGFNQWVKKVLQPRDIAEMKEREMRAIGIEDFSVIKLEYNEIKSLLETPQKYNGRYYKGLSKEQIEVIIAIKQGKFKVNLVEPQYYLSVKKLIDSKTISERSSKEGSKKSLYLARSVIGKILLSVISAMIFASLAKDLSASQDIASSLLKFATRVWAMVSSAFMGYIVGVQINDMDAEYIEMRINVQNMYLQDKTFKPLDQQEEAKQAFIERVKEEQVLKLDNKSNQIEMKS